jgi:hypothetical protein
MHASVVLLCLPTCSTPAQVRAGRSSNPRLYAQLSASKRASWAGPSSSSSPGLLGEVSSSSGGGGVGGPPVLTGLWTLNAQGTHILPGWQLPLHSICNPLALVRKHILKFELLMA